MGIWRQSPRFDICVKGDSSMFEMFTTLFPENQDFLFLHASICMWYIQLYDITD